MTKIQTNPFRGSGLPLDCVAPVDSADAVAHLLKQCPAHAQTPLVNAHQLAEQTGVGEVWIKDERARMGLGSFKALGAAFAIAREAEAVVSDDQWSTALSNRTFVTASAGNHGLSVAAGAQLFGAKAVIFLAESVPEAFAERLRSKGAQVERAGAIYEESMAAAENSAESNGWTLLSDSSWPGYQDLPRAVMEGYLQMAAEAVEQMPTSPTHILLQAGVGGLAAAVAAYARAAWGQDAQIIVVEPDVAPALQASIASGTIATTEGPVSSMGRLDCKTPSMIALKGLSRDADLFATITEQEGTAGANVLADMGLESTPSGAAGLSALIGGLDLPTDAVVFAILSEGPEDA